MSHQITLDNKTFTLIHRTNKKIKNISLSLENKDEIIIKTPLKFKSHMLKEIAYEHKDWILRSLNRVPAKNSFDFVSGGTIPFLGVNYPIDLIEDEKMKNVKFSFVDDAFIVQYNAQKQSYDDFIDGLKRFYKYNAIKMLNISLNTK